MSLIGLIDQQSHDETWRCITCGWTIQAVMITLTSLKPTAVGAKVWSTCRGTCNSTGELPTRRLELVAVHEARSSCREAQDARHAMITDEQFARIQRRAHVHDEGCYGNYEPCGEHHVHDDACSSRSRLCGTPEDGDLRALVAGYRALEADRRRIEWLSADASRLEDARGRVNNEGVPLRDTIDWLMAEAK